MSVTFTVFPAPAPVGYELAYWQCSPEPVTDRVPDRATAEQLAAEHTASCEDCAVYGGPLIEGVLVHAELNAANGNACRILEALGFGDEDAYLGGSEDGATFLARVLVALGTVPADAGVPATTSRGAGGATVIDCGRRPGYLDDRLRILHDVASYAADHGLQVSWA